jgi:hypothetical protein
LSPCLPRAAMPPRHLPPTPTRSTPCSALRCPHALAVPIHCRPWAVVEANPISPPHKALLPTSSHSVRVQRRPLTPTAIGDSMPRLRPRFNLHELRTGPTYLSDHSADFLDVCPSHSYRSPLPERLPSSSPLGTPPWVGRSGPPPASSPPPQASPRPGAPRRPHKLRPRPLQPPLTGEPPPSTAPSRGALLR